MKKLFLSMTGLSILGYVISLVNQILISSFFGTSYKVDAYWLSMYAIQMAIFYIGPAKEALVPNLHKKIKHDLKSGSVYFSEILNFILIVIVGTLLMVLIFPKVFGQLFVNDTSSDLAVEFFHVLVAMAPLIALMAMTELLNGVLIAQNVVLPQNITKILSASTIAVIVISLSKKMDIYAIITGAVFGQIIALLYQCIMLSKNDLRYIPLTRPRIDRSYLHMSSAMILAHAISQIYLIFEKNTLTTFGEGTVSAYQYGFALSLVPQMIIVTSLSVVIWPKILEAVHGEGLQSIIPQIVDALKLLTVILGFITVYCAIFSKHIIYILFYRGAFNLDSLSLTSACFKLAVFALVPAGFSIVIGRIIISLRHVKAWALISCINATIGILVLLAGRLSQVFHIVLLHAALATIANMCASLWFLKRFIGSGYSVLFSIKSAFWGVRFCLIIAAILLFYPVPEFSPTTKFELGIQVVIHLIGVGSIYLLLMLFCRTLKLVDIKRFFQSKPSNI